MTDVDYYPQDLSDFVQDWSEVRSRYHVVVLFYFHLPTPPANEERWWERRTKEALECIGADGQGVVVLHHAIAAFPEWPFW